MSWVDQLVVRIKRGESPATRLARDAYKRLVAFDLPDHEALRVLYGSLYRAHDAWEGLRELALGKLLYEPMVRARFRHVGKRLSVSALPYIDGHAQVTIGDDCSFSRFTVVSGRFTDTPELIFGDHCTVSSNAVFLVNKRVTIGSFVSIAPFVSISDSDGHPLDPTRRMNHDALRAEEIAPVTIHDHAWIGRDAHVMKGVTIGRAAIVASGSVVTGDVPPESLAMGVPARIIKKPW